VGKIGAIGLYLSKRGGLLPPFCFCKVPAKAVILGCWFYEKTSSALYEKEGVCLLFFKKKSYS
jgi:hypothetical protein